MAIFLAPSPHPLSSLRWPRSRRHEEAKFQGVQSAPKSCKCLSPDQQPHTVFRGCTCSQDMLCSGPHTEPPAGSLGCHRGLPARKRPLNWAVACWAAYQQPASACRGLCALVGSIFSQSWGTRGLLWCKPCSEQPKTPGKNENGPAGPSASQPSHSAPTATAGHSRMEAWPMLAS